MLFDNKCDVYGMFYLDTSCFYLLMKVLMLPSILR